MQYVGKNLNPNVETVMRFPDSHTVYKRLMESLEGTDDIGEITGVYDSPPSAGYYDADGKIELTGNQRMKAHEIRQEMSVYKRTATGPDGEEHLVYPKMLEEKYNELVDFLTSCKS